VFVTYSYDAAYVVNNKPVAGKINVTLPISVSTPILTAEEGTKVFHLVGYSLFFMMHCIVSSASLLMIFG